MESLQQACSSLDLASLLFLYKGIIFEFFLKVGKTPVVMERFTICVRSGKISGLISLMMEVSISSELKEVELLRPDTNFSTSSGCAALKEKEHVLPSISDLILVDGSDKAAGRFYLIREIFSRT